MRNFIIIIWTVLFISGCNNSFLPGMQGIPVSSLPKREVLPYIQVQPTVVPITPALIICRPPAFYVYHIAPQDVLTIYVWRHPEFNPTLQSTSTTATQSTQAAGQSGYLVDSDGYIYFPLVGKIYVAGKTIDKVRVEITHRLGEYIRNPQVIVRVGDYRSKKVYVLGEVIKPSLLPLNDQPMSITDALTLAGSYDPTAADMRHIYVIRGSFVTPTIYWLNARTPDALLLAQQFHLQPGDILYVSSAIMTDWNRFLNQILPTAQTAWFTWSLIKHN